MNKILYTLFEDETFRLSYEVEDEKPILHCSVYKFTSKTFRKGLSEFLKAIDYLHSQGYESVYAITPKPKLAEMAGGEYMFDFPYENTLFKVYVWKLLKP